MHNQYIVLLSICLLFPACWQTPSAHDAATSSVAQVAERFMTPVEDGFGIDSIAIWHGPQGQHWLLATAKSAHALVAYDAETGERVAVIGQQGTGPGEFIRPNGIAVMDDLVFVVERDGKRMQVIDLPTLRVCGTTHGQLESPYGIAVARRAKGKYDAYVTENAGIKGHITPKKIYHYSVERLAGGCSIKLVQIFGDTDGAGALWKVESLAVDPVHNRLFIADEHPERNDIKVYTLDGTFTGTIIGKGLIKSEPEGIAIYPTDDTRGYIICTDQDKQNNVFWLFDRVTLEPLGSFSGNIVRNTDGIACTTRAFGQFDHGALYAVHEDGSIGAYNWQDIMQVVDARASQTDKI